MFLTTNYNINKTHDLLTNRTNITVSHNNCPHQIILYNTKNTIENTKQQLKKQHVLYQVLPFHSGFHSPLFNEFVAPHQTHFTNLPIQTPTIPLWSTTNTKPYSNEPDNIHSTTVTHLTKPIRFQKIVKKLYKDNIRCFVQIGPNNLTNFINDTLRNQPHLTVTTINDHHSTLHQLQQLRYTLITSGLQLEPTTILPTQITPPPTSNVPLSLKIPLISIEHDLPILTPTSTPTDLITIDDPIIQKFNHILHNVITTNSAVIDTYHSKLTPTETNDTPTHNDQKNTRTLSIDTYPTLINHTFFHQPTNWPHMTNRFPIVPLTMIIEMIIETKQTLTPEQYIVSVQHLRTYK